MLEKPDLPDEELRSALNTSFDVNVRELNFLPVGADTFTAVYRAIDRSGDQFFVRLRRGKIESPSLIIPELLRQAGAGNIIPPRRTKDGALWAEVREFTLTLYPFISGSDGFSQSLDRHQLMELGGVLRQLHELRVPDDVRASIDLWSFDVELPERIRRFQHMADEESFEDTSARRLANSMKQNEPTISHIIEMTEQLAAELPWSHVDSVLCHGDIHAGNVLINADGYLYVVDWDTLTLAPREKDLMFIGAGIAGTWTRADDIVHFYEGYGSVNVDQRLVTFFRLERILIDFDEFASQLFRSEEGGNDREQAVRYFTGQFEAGDVVDMALRSLERLRR